LHIIVNISRKKSSESFLVSSVCTVMPVTTSTQLRINCIIILRVDVVEQIKIVMESK